MTLTEAMQYRGLTAWKLAERTGVKTQTAKKWTEPGGMAEDAANLLCEALTEARAQVLAWANDHGEP